MQIIRRKKMTLLLADDNKLLRDINDIYTPETKNQDGSVTPEHIPYTTDLIFLPLDITEDEIKSMYVEE